MNAYKITHTKMGISAAFGWYPNPNICNNCFSNFIHNYQEKFKHLNSTILHTVELFIVYMIWEFNPNVDRILDWEHIYIHYSYTMSKARIIHTNNIQSNRIASYGLCGHLAFVETGVTVLYPFNVHRPFIKLPMKCRWESLIIGKCVGTDGQYM